MNILKNLKTIKNKAMKTLSFSSIVLLFVLFSCNSGNKINGQKVSFGIHEVVERNEIPNSIIDSLKSNRVQIENNQQYMIGYITKADSQSLNLDVSDQNFKLVKTIYPVDKEQNYYAVVAIMPGSGIDNSHIKKTQAKGNNVEIYFNFEGAKKWAEMTRQNIGKTVAFVIDNQIYTMPLINGETLNGVALINNLKNETFAKNLSASLNSGISK
jgi:preprotein translocase subunit SecD